MNRTEILKMLDDKKKALIEKLGGDESAKNLVSELCLLQKQSDIVPLNTYDIGKELKRIEGKTFRMSINENGALVHIYNNIEYLVNINNKALYDLIDKFIDSYEGKDKDEKEIYEAIYTALPYIFAVPTWAAMDINFLFEIATMTIKNMKEYADKADGTELADEDNKANDLFKEVSMILSESTEKVKEE